MREIKFRVWDKTEKELVYVKGFFISNDAITYFTNSTKSKSIKAADADIMQYTGIKDSNSIEIYEGDIVQVKDDDKIKNYIVTWRDRQAAFGFEYFIVDSWALSWDEETIPSPDKWEVAGNIYENPDLIDK
jgi:uncharacterized phage protein (TIGR01671 family)